MKLEVVVVSGFPFYYSLNCMGNFELCGVVAAAGWRQASVWAHSGVIACVLGVFTVWPAPARPSHDTRLESSDEDNM